ncbi:MAG: thioredoxin family protein [Cytophagales bacterium]|nr:thioredoxin family protein [Cytophagales bacterium]
MRNFSFLLVTLFSVHGLVAQILEPAKWSYDVSSREVRVGDEIELIFKAIIDQDWYLYSSDFDPDLGPMLTEFEFEPHESYALVGEIIPVNPKEKYDEIWEGNVKYFKGTGEFRQKVKILGESPIIRGSYSYQVCSDIDGKCIPFDDEFTFNDFEVDKSGGGGTGFTPEIKTESLNLSGVQEENEKAFKEDPPTLAAQEKQAEKGLLKSRDTYSPYSLLSFMIVAFLAGLAALFTPCVFPMIPMTVTFFTGKAKSRKQGIRNAFIYGFSIIFIYTLIGSVVAPFMGPEMANELATNWIPNLIFFLVFVIFALSFFGLFEINLPNSWVNKADKQADKGGLGGIFFMAFTLVLVSFSCTGPLVGSILVEAAGGLFLKPILGMFAFAMAFAIPFTLFAIFPEWLNSLPKSGGWLNSVKVVLGFLELAFALKFISVADQAYHWGILDREVYLAFWIVIFMLMGLYLLGKIRLPNDSPMEIISVPRLILAILIFAFVTYLIPGMFGAPLKALAGYLPPMSTHDFNLMQAENNSRLVRVSDEEKLCDKPKYSDFLHFPHGIKGYFDYQQALACAKEQNKPIFIDFTGHGCVNCREMEARVWSDPEVLKRLNEDFIMLALYVDDKKELPESEWYVSAYDNKVKKTIGKQNADLQITKFNNNAQPFYIIMNHDEELLLEPKSYDLSISNFIAFLEAGKQSFEARK